MKGVSSFSIAISSLAFPFSVFAQAQIDDAYFEGIVEGAHHVESGFTCPFKFGDMSLKRAYFAFEDTFLCDYKSSQSTADFVWIMIEKEKGKSAKSAHRKSVKNLTTLSSGEKRRDRVREDFSSNTKKRVYGTIWSRKPTPGFGSIGLNGERGFWTTHNEDWTIDFSVSWSINEGADLGLEHARGLFTGEPVNWDLRL